MDALPDPDTIRQLEWSSGRSLGTSNQGEARHFRLESGDSLFFDADAPHGPDELIELPARYLSIICYPQGGS